MIVTILILSVIIVLMGVVFLKGKGDLLIAGYNTASPQKKAQYDIKRLRLVVALFHFTLAALFYIFLLKDKDLAESIFICGVAVFSILVVVLANTWAKKR